MKTNYKAETRSLEGMRGWQDVGKCELSVLKEEGRGKKKGKSISEMKIKLEGSQGKIDTGKYSVQQRQ